MARPALKPLRQVLWALGQSPLEFALRRPSFGYHRPMKHYSLKTRVLHWRAGFSLAPSKRC